MIKNIIVILLIFSFSMVIYSSGHSEDFRKYRNNLNRNGMLFLTAYGLIFWDYGSSSFKVKSEKWFSQNTKYGGADKFGHSFIGYLIANECAISLYKHGYERRVATSFGAMTSIYMSTFVEIGDGFSGDHGFSTQDAIMNFLGALFAYQRFRDENFRKRFDFRWEYIPSDGFVKAGESDITTDYSGSKYLLVYRIGEDLKTDKRILKSLEIQLGYYSRGYVDYDNDYGNKRRYIYFGIGFSLDTLTNHKDSRFLKYYQIPGTSIEFEHEQ